MLDRKPLRFLLRVLPVGIALVWLLGLAHACDPDHDWEEVRSFSRRTLGYQAAAGILLQASAVAGSRGQAFRPGLCLAIVALEDAYGRTGCLTAAGDGTRAATAEEKAALLADFEETLAHLLERDYGVRVVRLAQVRALEARLGAEAPSALYSALGREHGATAFLSATLTAYAQTMRLHRDKKPENHGLFLAQSFSMAQARVTLRKADGLFAVAEDFGGHGASSVIYFGVGREPSPVRKLIQVQAGRPGVVPCNWQLYPDRDHFETSPAATGLR